MIKILKLVKNIIFFNPVFLHPKVARHLVKLAALFHNLCYRLISRYAISCDGVHPKHEIVNYFKFFSDHISPEGSVLDVGCSSGELLEKIAISTSGQVTGVEIDEAKAIKATKRLAHINNVEVVNSDIWDFKPSMSYDYLTLSNVLEHLDNRVDLLKYLLESIKPKTVLIRVPMLMRSWEVAYKRKIGVEWRLDSTHQIEYTEEEFFRELREAGLKIKDFSVRWGEFYAVAVPD